MEELANIENTIVQHLIIPKPMCRKNIKFQYVINKFERIIEFPNF